MQFTAPLPFGTSRVPNPFLLFLPVFVEESNTPSNGIPKGKVEAVTVALRDLGMIEDLEETGDR